MTDCLNELNCLGSKDIFSSINELDGYKVPDEMLACSQALILEIILIHKLDEIMVRATFAKGYEETPMHHPESREEKFFVSEVTLFNDIFERCKCFLSFTFITIQNLAC